METEFYTCEFCQTKFKPYRRKVQKFCSSTCRVKNHQHKNRVEKPMTQISNIPLTETEVLESTIIKPDKLKIEKISTAGVANTVLGNIITDSAKALGKHLFNSPENDPATKKDIEELKSLLNKRYFKINNLPTDDLGGIPHFDMSNSTVVYLGRRLFNAAKSML